MSFKSCRSYFFYSRHPQFFFLFCFFYIKRFFLSRRKSHSTTRPQGDKLKMLRSQMRHLLKCVRVKGEKTSVNWVTCHRCIPALLVIPPGEPSLDQGEGLSAACGAVSCCLSAQRCAHIHVWQFCLCPFTSRSTSHLHRGQSVHWPQPDAPTVFG